MPSGLVSTEHMGQWDVEPKVSTLLRGGYAPGTRLPPLLSLLTLGLCRGLGLQSAAGERFHK